MASDAPRCPVLILPYPPTVNHYWLRNRNGSVRISPAGLAFRQEVALKCRQERIKRLTGRLAVVVEAFPPDNRRRDLDNVLKALLDALQHGGAFEDDSQIDDLRIIRMASVPKNPQVWVTLALLK